MLQPLSVSVLLVIVCWRFVTAIVCERIVTVIVCWCFVTAIVCECIVTVTDCEGIICINCTHLTKWQIMLSAGVTSSLRYRYMPACVSLTTLDLCY